MKRPSGLALGVIAGFAALVVTEIIVWWPDPPKKHSEEPPAEPGTVVAIPHVAAPSPKAPAVASAPPPRPGRTIPQLQANESDELRRLEGCGDKRCGDPCIFRCDPNTEDGRCVNGRRPGACTADGVCSTTLPAVCPGPDDPPP